MPRFAPEPFPAAWRYPVFVHPSALARCNRVDGIVQSLEIRTRLPWRYDRPPLIEPFGRVDVNAIALSDYHVHGGTFGLGVNLSRPLLGADHGIWIHADARYRKETVSPDDWIVGDAENTLAALFAKEDYKNYYLAEGFDTRWTAKWITQSQKLTISLDYDFRYEWIRSLEVTTNWGALPVRHGFRSNFVVPTERQESGYLAIAAQIQDSPRAPHRIVSMVWNVRASGPWRGPYAAGEFTTLRLEQQTCGGQRLTLRLMSGGVVPPSFSPLQANQLIRLGGIGTLRGLPHQVLVGNRIWMVNAEYRFGNDLLGRFTFWPFNYSVSR